MTAINSKMLKGTDHMKTFKRLLALMLALILVASMSTAVFAAENGAAPEASSQTTDGGENTVRDFKAISAAVIIALVAAGGAIAMALTIMKTIDGIARQPEAAGNIRGAMMLGLVFIETAIIYALIVAILIVFVL